MRFGSRRSQRQSAGTNSQLIQVSGDLNLGVTEHRAREIAHEAALTVVSGYHLEAQAKVTERIDAVGARLIPELESEGLLQAMADPAFYTFLKKAQASAACIDSEADQDLLTRLIVERARKDTPRNRLIIEHAVQSIDRLSEETSSALTACWFVVRVTPLSPTIEGALGILEERLEPLLSHLTLPDDSGWIDELDLLGCIRTSSGQLAKMRPFPEILVERLHLSLGRGVAAVDAQPVLERLGDLGLPQKLLPSPLDPERLVLPACSQARLVRDLREAAIAPDPVSAAQELIELAQLAERAPNALLHIENLIEADYPRLSQLTGFWSSIQHAIQLTPVGIVLGYSNARRWMSMNGLGDLSAHLQGS